MGMLNFPQTHWLNEGLFVRWNHCVKTLSVIVGVFPYLRWKHTPEITRTLLSYWSSRATNLITLRTDIISTLRSPLGQPSLISHHMKNCPGLQKAAYLALCLQSPEQNQKTFEVCGRDVAGTRLLFWGWWSQHMAALCSLICESRALILFLFVRTIAKDKEIKKKTTTHNSVLFSLKGHLVLIGANDALKTGLIAALTFKKGTVLYRAHYTHSFHINTNIHVSCYCYSSRGRSSRRPCLKPGPKVPKVPKVPKEPKMPQMS